MIVLYFIPLLFLALMPRQLLYSSFKKLEQKFRRESLLTRGESLLQWLDSFGLNGVGFDLGSELPRPECYKSFGIFIHRVWQDVQVRGGELGPYFQVIKSLLRVDIKREYEQGEALKLVRFQIVAILVLVWLFLFCLSQVLSESLEPVALMLIACWQLLGLLIGFHVIKRLKGKLFDPISELLALLLALHSLRFSGNLAEASLNYANDKDKKACLIFKRMEGVILMWRQRGSHDSTALTELLEDIVALSQHRSDKFKRLAPGFFFIWCSTFVLPVLFLSTLISLGSQI